ncbi:ABC-type branched-subunit amino acid transport system permease subunit [Pedobacter sp. UYP24]
MQETKGKISNSVWAGLAVGLVLPALLLSLAWYLMHRFAFLAKADLLLIAAIAVNALLMHYFFKQDKEKTARGVVSATFLWAFAFFFYKISQS